ncbi:hypothetical protein KCU65_g4142, partial [Aureobasidium melanogenum]
MSPNSAISSPPTPGIASGTHTPVGHRMVAAKKADGYRLFSDFISSDPLRSTTIFRRFDRLAMRNLLYLESELAALESEVERLDMDLIPETMINHLGDWTILKAEAEYAEEDTSENISEEEARKQELMIARMRLIKKIRVKVKEYHEALKLMTEILALERPEHDDIETNGRIFVQSDEDGYDHDHWQDKAESYAIIQGAMSLHLCEENRKDLCTLAPQVERDPLTRLVESKHQLRNMIKDRKTGLTSLSKWNRLNKFITWISVCLVVVWLVGAIVGLYFWQSNHGRLILLSVLTLGFAFSILSLTTARRHDVFASTAGYAAVLVVFIGSTLQKAGPQSQASSTSSKIRMTRDLQPTRTYLATGLEIDYTSDKIYVITLSHQALTSRNSFFILLFDTNAHFDTAMPDINYRTKSWKQQVELTTDDANEIARLLGVDLKFKKGQQLGTFEPLNEEEQAEKTPPDKIQQQKQPQTNDDEYEKYGFIISGTWLARRKSGHQAMINLQDDLENDPYDDSHTTTHHTRQGTAPKPDANHDISRKRSAPR